jgi:hypothetical protein
MVSERVMSMLSFAAFDYLKRVQVGLHLQGARSLIENTA